MASSRSNDFSQYLAPPDNPNIGFSSHQIEPRLGSLKQTTRKQHLSKKERPPSAHDMSKMTTRKLHLSKKERPPSAHDMSKMFQLNKAIGQNVVEFIDGLSLKADTPLLDKLLEIDCLVQHDYDFIRQGTTDKQMIERLIVKIKDSSPEKIQLFLQTLDNDPAYNHLARKVSASLEQIKKDTKLNEVECVFCVMKGRVAIDDISAYLWRDGIIPGKLYSAIVECERGTMYSEPYWDEVIKNLNSFSDRKKAIETLKTALGSKHDHVVRFLPQSTPLECCCWRKRQLRKLERETSSDSDDERSTTSEVTQIDSSNSSCDEDQSFMQNKNGRVVIFPSASSIQPSSCESEERIKQLNDFWTKPRRRAVSAEVKPIPKVTLTNVDESSSPDNVTSPVDIGCSNLGGTGKLPELLPTDFVPPVWAQDSLMNAAEQTHSLEANDEVSDDNYTHNVAGLENLRIWVVSNVMKPIRNVLKPGKTKTTNTIQIV